VKRWDGGFNFLWYRGVTGAKKEKVRPERGNTQTFGDDSCPENSVWEGGGRRDLQDSNIRQILERKDRGQFLGLKGTVGILARVKGQKHSFYGK